MKKLLELFKYCFMKQFDRFMQSLRTLSVFYTNNNQGKRK